MKEVVVNSGRAAALNPEYFENKYSASFVGQFTNNSDRLVDVYYQKVKPFTEYSHYFAICMYSGSSVYIMSGKFIEDVTITGIVAADKEIIYSRHRHDYRTSTDGSVWIDGGFSYTRTNKPECLIALRIISGKFYHVEDNIV